MFRASLMQKKNTRNSAKYSTSRNQFHEVSVFVDFFHPKIRWQIIEGIEASYQNISVKSLPDLLEFRGEKCAPSTASSCSAKVSMAWSSQPWSSQLQWNDWKIRKLRSCKKISIQSSFHGWFSWDSRKGWFPPIPAIESTEGSIFPNINQPTGSMQDLC